LEELAPSLYRNTSIKEVLDMSRNNLIDMESAEILRDIIRRNKTITSLVLTGNEFGRTTGAVECIADGVSSNSTVLKIDLSRCILRDGGVSILARSLGSRNITLHKLALSTHYITSAGVAVLLDEAMQQRSPATDLELKDNPIGNESVILLARSLENNALSNLTRLSL
jgi:Ran GTPase-activating protein (RanGAP) involved in mRNA processing and transport